MKKKWMLLLAVVLTLFFAVFQRMTGPTHAAGGKVERADGNVGFSLPRSGTVGSDTRIEMPSSVAPMSGATQPDPGTEAYLCYRHYPAAEGEAYVRQPMQWENGQWVGFLPTQPMAGKLSYYIEANGTEYFSDAPLVIRYRGDVPAAVLIPHILLMFLAMFFAVMSGLSALADDPAYKKYSLLTLICLLLGGFVFGCLVQHYAFGIYWSGFPVGGDLTDNKTLIALVAFLAAFGVQAFRKKARWAVLAASIVMLGIFCVPHSANGSELDRETGRIESGR